MIKMTVLDRSETTVAREDMLFCVCPLCSCEINWRHFDASHELYANCCTMAYHAIPIKEDAAVYLIASRAVDLGGKKNVVRLPVNIVASAPPPRYG